jgi:hypothetical protein
MRGFRDGVWEQGGRVRFGERWTNSSGIKWFSLLGLRHSFYIMALRYGLALRCSFGKIGECPVCPHVPSSPLHQGNAVFIDASRAMAPATRASVLFFSLIMASQSRRNIAADPGAQKRESREISCQRRIMSAHKVNQDSRNAAFAMTNHNLRSFILSPLLPDWYSLSS